MDRTSSTIYHIELGALSRCGAVKSIILLYVALLKDMEYYSVKQFKLRVTKEDMKTYGIRPEQHKLQHVRKALQYLENEGRKIPLRTRSSIRTDSVNQYRQLQLNSIDTSLELFPHKEAARQKVLATRAKIEQSLTKPQG